ncbi:MAG: hypothetical protein M1812_006281 [Candelaria pacifica]|nr:MAG: hypothetical protein M1812_006281 [Candelaria pacifica]
MVMDYQAAQRALRRNNIVVASNDRTSPSGGPPIENTSSSTPHVPIDSYPQRTPEPDHPTVHPNDQSTPTPNDDYHGDKGTLSTSRTRKSIFSGSFWTARSSMYWSTKSITTIEQIARRRNYKESQYQRLIRENVLQQTRQAEEPLDWSGLGQHIEVAPGKPVPCIQSRHVIAHTNRSLVEEVLCRRVRLVRKSTFVRRDCRTSSEQKLQEALSEVRQLSSLRHNHVIQLIGTYLQGDRFSMLLYPVADSDLATVLETYENSQPITYDEGPEPLGPGLAEAPDSKRSLVEGTICLLDALRYVHDNCIRHLDIKPQNVLARRTVSQREHFAFCFVLEPPITYHFYLCDFGISKEFTDPNESKSVEPPARTLTYCSLEIFNYGEYVALGRRLNDFIDFRCAFEDHAEDSDGEHRPEDISFQGHLAGVFGWIESLKVDLDVRHASNEIQARQPVPSWYHHLAWHEPIERLDSTGKRNPLYQRMPVSLVSVQKMLNVNPSERPTLAEMERQYYDPWYCCIGINPTFEIEEKTNSD